MGTHRRSLRQRVSKARNLLSLSRDSSCKNFSARSIELRFGITYRDYYEQKIYAAALARQTGADIAIVKLVSNVRVTNYVRPALLPRVAQKNELFADKVATVCGMGIENQQTNAVSYFLKYADLRVMSQAACRPFYGDVDVRVLCAISATTSNASSCPGENKTIKFSNFVRFEKDFKTFSLKSQN